MEEQRFYNEILFVIVVYEKALGQVSSLNTIHKFYRERKSEATIFIYDNSKTSQSVPNLINYMHDAANSGVSRAYNIASDFAVDRGKQWMCLLDQDTDVDEKMLTEYFHSFRDFGNERVFVPRIIFSRNTISPFKTLLGKGYSYGSTSPGRQPIKKFNAINSGLLIDVSTFKKAGGYDERYPLDLSDYVFWKRLSKIETSFVVTKAVCEHHLSSDVTQPERAVIRFKIFLNANRQYRRDPQSGTTLIPVISRGLKLSWRFKDISFIRLALKSFIQPI
jgi:GT2 family glycosyltransferase